MTITDNVPNKMRAGANAYDYLLSRFGKRDGWTPDTMMMLSGVPVTRDEMMPMCKVIILNKNDEAIFLLDLSDEVAEWQKKRKTARD